jgi:hypothetical protein
MASVSFDTYRAVKEIREAGASEPLASAIVQAMQRTADLPDVSTLATRDDVTLVKTELATEIALVKAELATEIALVRAELATEIAAGKGELKAGLAALDAKLTMLLWIIGVLGVGSIAAQALHLIHAI